MKEKWAAQTSQRKCKAENEGKEEGSKKKQLTRDGTARIAMTCLQSVPPESLCMEEGCP